MVIAKNLSNNVLFYHQENANKPDSKKTKINLVNDIYDYVKNLENENILKFTISDNSSIIFNSIIKKLREIKKYIKKMKDFLVIIVYKKSKKIIEIKNK